MQSFLTLSGGQRDDCAWQQYYILSLKAMANSWCPMICVYIYASYSVTSLTYILRPYWHILITKSPISLVLLKSVKEYFYQTSMPVTIQPWQEKGFVGSLVLMFLEILWISQGCLCDFWHILKIVSLRTWGLLHHIKVIGYLRIPTSTKVWGTPKLSSHL